MLEAAASVPGVTHTALSPRFVSALLYGVDPYDPATIAGTISTLTAVGLLAGWLPARRASQIDPMRVLRER
jgi:ABC-type lipoprotein release transport system permease subunit